MNEAHDPNGTVDVSCMPADSLDAGLAAGFGKSAFCPRSTLSHMPPVLLNEPEGDSSHVVRPKSDAMPTPAEAGDRYQLSGEIARGGMGAVLRGRDVDLGRDLAVKVLLEKYRNRPDVAQRFIGEAQITGQLQHPGIVPVYDIGRFGERPFFTMKLVKGRTLAALLGERCDPAADQQRFLNISLQVAQTIAYAHAKGVIHRDLKPGNIMVGAFGEVQVMDWGLAKVLAQGGVADEERASRAHLVPEDVTTIRTARSTGSGDSFGSVTEAGSLLGTPAYMPPEQANGDISILDRRADVFGLGAILCETLTGKPPYVGRSSEEVRRKACNGDLADTIVRLEGSGADMELIELTQRCLAAEASDRPKDAQAVADALKAHLNGLRERLHQAELAEAEANARAREEAKRRRLTLALAGTVLVALMVGGGSWLWMKNEREARQMALSRDVNEALNRATAFREQARAATTGSAALLAQAREQAQRALALVETGPADAVLIAQVSQLQTALNQEEKDHKLVAALEEAKLAQAESVTENRFAMELAVPLFREAFRAYGLAVGEGDPSAVAERIKQRPAAIQAAILAALDEWDALAVNASLQITEPHREWLQAVVSAAESEDSWSRQVRAARAEKDKTSQREALERLATGADETKIPAMALNQLALRLAPAPRVALLRRAQLQYPGDFWINQNLGLALGKVNPPQLDEAVRFQTACVAMRPDSSGARNNLGNALKRKGELDAAIVSFRKAIELAPKNFLAHLNLGEAFFEKGEWNKAIASYRNAIAFDSSNARAHDDLGRALRRTARLDEAVAAHREATRLDPQNAVFQNNFGVVLSNRKLYEPSLAAYREAIRLKPDYALAHNNVGRVFQFLGKFDEAIPAHREAIRLDPQKADYHNDLGIALSRTKQFEESIAAYREAISLKPDYASAQDKLGKLLEALGKTDEAASVYEQAMEADSGFAETYSDYARLLANAPDLKSRNTEKALALAQKAVKLDSKKSQFRNTLGMALYRGKNYPAALKSLHVAMELAKNGPNSYSFFFLAMTHWQLGDKNEARKWFDKGVQWMEQVDPDYIDERRLERHRAEAAELLGVNDKRMEEASGTF
jgi:eukaryotic-like serine/threonine-protein kinase